VGVQFCSILRITGESVREKVKWVFYMHVLMYSFFKDERYFVNIVHEHMHWKSCQVMGLKTICSPDVGSLAAGGAEAAFLTDCPQYLWMPHPWRHTSQVGWDRGQPELVGAAHWAGGWNWMSFEVLSVIECLHDTLQIPKYKIQRSCLLQFMLCLRFKYFSLFFFPTDS